MNDHFLPHPQPPHLVTNQGMSMWPFKKPAQKPEPRKIWLDEEQSLIAGRFMDQLAVGRESQSNREAYLRLWQYLEKIKPEINHKGAWKLMTDAGGKAYLKEQL